MIAAAPREALCDEITNARRTQLAARIARAHSPNPDTIAAEKTATRELDMLLDRLSAAYHHAR